MNGIFVADMEWLCESPFAPDYWIAGTNIFTGEATLGKTRVVSNALGHPIREGTAITHENAEFDFDRVFETVPKPRQTKTLGM
jgi:hypothetical protein